MTGWVLTPGRRTITRVLTLADPEGRRAHDACHRFVRAGRRATGNLRRALAIRAAGLTRPDGAAGLLAGDTLAHKIHETHPVTNLVQVTKALHARSWIRESPSGTVTLLAALIIHGVEAFG
jgi:hypothetical protein